MQESIKFGNHCCLKELHTDTNKDIFKYPVRIDAFILAICSDGVIELSYNLNHITLSSNSLFLYLPGSIIRLNTLQPSKLSIMMFTREFIDELGMKFDNIPLQYRIMREIFTTNLNETSRIELQSMLRLTSGYIYKNKTNMYYSEMVKTSFKSFIYRALYEINACYGKTTSEILPAQNNNHFDRFMRLLEENYMNEHAIRFYSDKMGLSPKYLSLMIKKASGKLATEWIDEYVILEAKNLIKYSSMSIQEIAYALNFPNQSFFGKFFKRHTGISPKAYRLKP